MEIREDFYLFKLQEELSRRQRVNASYSLRAYAADLNIDSSNLSAIFRRKRGLPAKRAEGIAERLGLSPMERALFISSVYRKTCKIDQIPVVANKKKYLLDEAHYRLVAEWEYYAVLSLMETDDFQSDPEWMAERLDVSRQRIEVVLGNLKELGFIEEKTEQKIERKVAKLETSEDIFSQALQKSHVEAMQLANKKIAETDVSQRDYSSMTMAIDPRKMNDAKAIIREFEDKMQVLMNGSQLSEVYQLNVQFFPLTKVKASDEKTGVEDE